MFNTATIGNIATSLVGTAFFGIAAIAIVTPPAHAASAGYQQAVEARIDNTLRFPRGADSDASGVTTLAVFVGADGTVRNVDVVKSSGQKSFDKEAIRTANAVRYPATGKARTIAMVLGFNKEASRSDAAHGKMLVEAYRTDRRQLLATQTTAQPAG